DLASPDYELDLLAPQGTTRRALGSGSTPDDQPPPPPPPPNGERGFRGPEQRGPITMLVGQRWKLLVKHRAGSVVVAAMQFRRRNLAISFGVLVVLGVGAVAMVISGSR